MNTTALRALALENGFSRAYVFYPEKAERPSVNRLNERVSDDAREIFEDARRVIVLLYAYQPYEEKKDQPSVSAYYVSSNAAYHAARRVAQEIEKEGYRAVSNAQIAIKPYLLKMGVGETGLNSLVSVPGLGTRFHAQIILTDLPLEADLKGVYGGISALCAGCGACIRACPGGAISGDGRVDIGRCLRAMDEGETVPEWMRAKFGGRILGCDVCQDVCPRNKETGRTAENEQLRETLDLKALLNGNVRALSGIIGRNYARRERIRLKAILACANLNRRDLTEDIRAIFENGTQKEKIHAQWALEQLEREDQL